MSPQTMTYRAVMAAVFSATTALAAAPQAAEKTAKVPGLVAEIKVLPDKAPDCSSLKSIVESITRECKTNDEKAIAIYNFMQLTHYHFAYPGEPGGLPVLKEINCYGWSLCGGLHSEESALWRQLGWGWRFVGWDGHTTVEANYDGKWHYLDAFLKFYAWKPDPGRPGRTHHRRRRRIDEPLRGTHRATPSCSTRPASASMRRTTSSAATATRSTGRRQRFCPAATSWRA